jgi:hypothetical protein
MPNHLPEPDDIVNYTCPCGCGLRLSHRVYDLKHKEDAIVFVIDMSTSEVMMTMPLVKFKNQANDPLAKVLLMALQDDEAANDRAAGALGVANTLWDNFIARQGA